MFGMTRREYIATQWDCLTFAQDVLHLHVDARGRAKSLKGQHGTANLALSINPDVWFDHKLQVGGGVVELCAWGLFDGDIGRAMEYLAGDFYDVDGSEWSRNIKRITEDCTKWHKKLLQDDREYLHQRRITDETIKRLQLGSMTADETGKYPRRRLVIPYFQNDRIVYYISRDRMGLEESSKYMKCKLPREKDGRTDKEVLQNIAWGLHTLSRRKQQYQTTIDDAGIDKRKWLIIAEGAFDAMSFEQEGYIVLATMGGDFSPSALPQVMGWAKEFENVLVIFDNDKAGKAFTLKMAQRLFKARANFYIGEVPETFEGQEIKDVSDYYALGGNLADLIREAKRGVEVLADGLTDTKQVQEFLSSVARIAQKSSVMELFQRIKGLKRFNPLWLRTVYEESVKAPPEAVTVNELIDRHNLKYIESSGFFEYKHGVWVNIPKNKVKGYADKILGRYASDSRMTSIMKFAQARLTSDAPMNSQPVINLLNGVLLPNEGCRFVEHNPAYLSTIQLTFKYDPAARCDLWRKFIADIMENNAAKMNLLQEIGGYIFWPNNGLEKCFFLIGDGGNGKGVFMDTIRDVFGRDNCSALPLSSFGGQFDPIMLQYSLVNFASETRVDLRGNIERLKEVTSGNDIVAAHKGIDAIKFAPRCKLITSCNDFFNTGDITHALMRRMVFVKFNRNMVQLKRADVYLKDKLQAELPGIFNWCIEGYMRLLERASQRSTSIFTETEEDAQQKREFMRTTNPVAFFIEEQLQDIYDTELDTHDLYYRQYKDWAEKSGYKTISLGAFTNRIKRVLRELRPEVEAEERRHHTWLKFPKNLANFEDLDYE